MSTVTTMVQGLEKALARATLADDRELAGKVREQGRRVVFLLNSVLRMTRLYEPDNAAFAEPCLEMAEALRGLLDMLGTVHIVCVEDQIYVNDIRLRLGGAEQAVADSFIEELARHRVGGISIHGELSPEQVKTLAIAFSPAAASPGPSRERLRSQLAPLPGIEIMGTYRFKVGGDREIGSKDISDAISQCEWAVRETLQNLATQRMPNPLPIRRSVIELLEALRADPADAMTAPAKRREGMTVPQHAVSVSTLAMLLGEAVGLSEAALSDLGVAAMLHDVGSIHRADWAGHSAAGARILMRQRGFHEAKIRRLLLVLEHHMPYLGARRSEEEPVEEIPSLFARILHIVDDYDLLTSPVAGEPPMMSPARALGSMWPARGRAYDPDLMALFARLLGRYPPGTLIELSDGRWAASISGGRDRERFEWPMVRMVRSAGGAARVAPDTVDLYETRDHLKPRLILDPSGDARGPVRSMVDGALHNPLQPDSRGLL